jgi:ferredoxin|uniref:Ferredoxin n=1 Tax=Desulfobacca acetoxidans TaxID=60893 RepID=A0A7C3WKM0_9BACT
MGKRVVVDKELCIGCGTCAGLCPDIFELDEAEGKSQVIQPEGGDENCINEAIESCPVSAISWQE